MKQVDKCWLESVLLGFACVDHQQHEDRTVRTVDKLIDDADFFKLKIAKKQLEIFRIFLEATESERDASDGEENRAAS